MLPRQVFLWIGYTPLALWTVPGGLVGARLVHVIDYWSYYSANPGTILAFWEGGLALWGGILGGTLVAVIFARIRGFPLARYADLAALGLLLAQAIGRIGDVINGEHINLWNPSAYQTLFLKLNFPNFPIIPKVQLLFEHLIR